MAQKVCQHCQTTFEARRSKVKFCSLQCSADSRPTSTYQQWGRKGGFNRAEKEKARIIEKYKALTIGMAPWQAFREGARWQLLRLINGYKMRVYRKGYAAGWEACAAAMDAAHGLRLAPPRRSVLSRSTRTK